MNNTFSLKNTIAQRAVESNSMYSVDGAMFQEYALSNLDYKNSDAHLTIGMLVTMINNKQISVNEAKARFNSLLATN